MSNKTSGVNYNRSSKAKLRRKKAIERLQDQLHKGTKFVNARKLGGDTNKQVSQPLTETDVKRINCELETLLSRI